jgi:YVTN family beta-propeller protein
MKTILSLLTSFDSLQFGEIEAGTCTADCFRTSVSLFKKFMFLSCLLGSASTGFAQPAKSVRPEATLPQNSVITTVSVGSYPFGLVVSPDDTTVYVANEDSGTVSVIDATNNYTVKATTTV